MKKTMPIILAMLVLLACTMPLTLSTPSPEAAACVPENTAREQGMVVGVIDGDTIEVRINGQNYKVRYIGMDTPEFTEPYYDEASSLNRAYVDGQEITLIKDVSETDQYGRLLRYIVIDERFVNYELVAQGYARIATFPPDVACADTFLEAEQQARAAGIGLWSRLP